jgi:hypothetical protein
MVGSDLKKQFRVGFVGRSLLRFASYTIIEDFETGA